MGEQVQHCLSVTVPHSQIPGLNTEKLVKSD